MKFSKPTRAQWNEVCTMLQEVNTTEISLRSKNGTTLWTRASPCLPTPEDDAFPLQVLTPPLTRELARMPEVIQIEATGLGGKNLGVDRPWDISIRTDPECENPKTTQRRNLIKSSLTFTEPSNSKHEINQIQNPKTVHCTSKLDNLCFK